MPLSPSKSGGGASSRGDNANSGLGVISQTNDVRLNTNAVAPAAGLIEASAIGLNAGDQITNILAVITVGGSGTAPTLIRVGIYDNAYNLVASSADMHASAVWTATGYAIAPLSAIYSVPLDGLYYIAFIRVGAYSVTQITMLHGSTQTNAGKAITGTKRYWWEQTGQTDLTNPATPASPTNAPCWFGVS